MFKKDAKEEQCPGVSVALVRALCGQSVGARGVLWGQEMRTRPEGDRHGVQKQREEKPVGEACRGVGRLPAWSVHPDF